MIWRSNSGASSATSSSPPPPPTDHHPGRAIPNPRGFDGPPDLRSGGPRARYFGAHIDRLRTVHPGHDEGWYHRRASRYISPPEVAPHVAGAAVDLTLCATDGHELWLGTEVNDTDTDACHTASTAISAEARGRRDILGEVLTTVGLVNYPTEWWHWSYGDRYWAHITRAPAARYGPVTTAGR
ncbi:M15 family metallopeptidase [Microbispora sp. CA-135349]|uniref:M15 family metallopeptidase n=1 Tax=Microbispora sp. CA-135349 TaxID=3239953 RepID=UPI003D8BA167